MKKEWYVVNTVSGHEYKVKEKLEMKINSRDLQENIFTSNSSCPADRSLNIWTNVYTFHFSKLCYWLSLLSNLILSIAIYFSINILLDD